MMSLYSAIERREGGWFTQLCGVKTWCFNVEIWYEKARKTWCGQWRIVSCRDDKEQWCRVAKTWYLVQKYTDIQNLPVVDEKIKLYFVIRKFEKLKLLALCVHCVRQRPMKNCTVQKRIVRGVHETAIEWFKSRSKQTRPYSIRNWRSAFGFTG